MRDDAQPLPTPDLFEAIFQQSLDVILIVDGNTGHILQSNAAMQRCLGYAADALTGQPIATLFATDDGESTATAEHLAAQPMHGAVFATQEIRHANGSFLPMDMTITTIAQPEGSRIIVTLRDASERRQAEQMLTQAHADLEQQIQERTAEIAERQRTEAALRQSEEQYRMLAEHMLDVVWTLDNDGNMTYVSPSVLHLRGYTPEEVLQQELHEILTPASAQTALEWLRTTTGASERLELEQPCKDGTTVWTECIISPIHDDEGTMCGWIGVSRDISERRQAEAQIHQTAARAEALVRIAARLNAQLDMDTMLETVCEETRSVLHTAIAGIALYEERTDSFVPVRGSGLSERLVKQSRPLSRSIIERLIQPARSALIVEDIQVRPPFCNMQACIETGMRTVAGVAVMREGTTIGFLMVATTHDIRTFTDDELSLLHGIAYQAAQAITNARLFADLRNERALLSRRIAERTADLSKANSELARAVRAKDEFLANMSHELRTPLNAILGLSEALQEHIHGPINERQHRALDTIDRSGRHLLSLINDILDLAKVEAGKIELEIEPVTIETVCHASLQFIKQQALKKSIGVSLHIAEALRSIYDTEQQAVFSPDHSEAQATIQADERRLKQILINLLNNAVKFTPEHGSVGLEVEADTEQSRVHFSVWDTGIGIAPTDQQRLFKPFIQIDSSLSRQYEGTGLGLALVMRLTELHGGTVSLESEFGRGSRFTVSLPWHPPLTDTHDAAAHAGRITTDGQQHQPQTQTTTLPHHAHSQTAEPPTTPHQSAAPSPLILVAEDNEANIVAIYDFLVARGYRVVVARNGLEALERVREQPPSLILMDIQMPGLDGLEAIQRIRADTRLADIPIIALTALVMPGDRERCIEAGANDYMSKPVRFQVLIQTIETHLNTPKQATLRS